MEEGLQRRLMSALERPHRLNMIGGCLAAQLTHSEAMGDLVARMQISKGWACDIGTGGGVPGLVLAALFPALDWRLIDARDGRCLEVERSSASLRLRNCQVICGLAQKLAHQEALRESHDLAVARGLGEPALVAECASGLLRVGGRLLVSEPPKPSTERWPSAELRRFGLVLVQIGRSRGHNFVVIEKVSRCLKEIPRLPPRSKRGWISDVPPRDDDA